MIEALDPVTTAGSTIVPAMTNLHSHAFQRGFAGLGESRGPDQDDFWSWRNQMYSFLDRLDPDDMLAVATMLYVELVRSGYGHVCEFHYVHNDRDGRPYADRTIMADALIEAARRAGIGLTLLPVLYTSGDFGGQLPEPGQRRFVMALDTYLGMLASLSARSAREGFKVGTAVHSLRAVEAHDLAAVLAARPADPIHMHIAEQEREVESSLNWTGQRPVEWLLANADVDARWTLVHATHMTDAEAAGLARTGATVALCPTTEGSLGDGFFNAEPFLENGGRFGIGSDSHVCTDPREELRLFEYGRRLVRRRRVLGVSPSLPHAGAWAWLRAAEAGANGSGVRLGAIKPGARADFLVLNGGHPSLVERDGDELLDGLVFGGGEGVVRECWVGGRRITADGHHSMEEAATDDYRRALSRLRGRL